MFGSFSSKFAYGRSKLPEPPDANVTLTTPGTSTPAYGSGGSAWTSTTNNALVNAGYTLLASTSADDSSVQVNIPFNFYLYGISANTLHVGTNTYITLNTGSTAYNSLKLSSPANPPYPAIHLGSADNSWQRVWWKNNTTNVAIRYEGAAGTTGTPGAPGIVYEIVFYQSNGTNQYVQINVGSHGRTSGLFGITNGSGSQYMSFGTIQANTNYVLRTNATGNSPIIYTGTYTP